MLELLLSEQCPLLQVCVSTAPGVCVCAHCSKCVCVCPLLQVCVSVCVPTAPSVCVYVCAHCSRCVCLCVCPQLQVCVCVCAHCSRCVCVPTAPSVCVCVCVPTAPGVCALGWVKCREHISLLVGMHRNHNSWPKPNKLKHWPILQFFSLLHKLNSQNLLITLLSCFTIFFLIIIIT